MIIAEGPDGAGKTTLVKELFEMFKDQFPLAVSGTRGPNVNVVERVHEALAYEVKAGNRPVIYDRLYFSELIYGKTLRGEVLFNQAQQRFIGRVLQFLDVPIIMCLPKEEKARENVRNSEQMAGVEKHFIRIYAEYEDWLNTLQVHNFNVMGYDYQNGISAQLSEIVFRYLTERKQREWKPVIESQILTGRMQDNPYPTESQR